MTANILSPRAAIKLDPIDWRWATWRDYTPPPRPAAMPFDQEATLARLGNIKTSLSWWSWTDLNLPIAMTREEAHFWLTLICLNPDLAESPVEDIVKKLPTKSFDGQISVDAIRHMIRGINPNHAQDKTLILVLANLSPITDLIPLLKSLYGVGFDEQAIINGFQEYIVPYLSKDERAIIHDLIVDEVRVTQLHQVYEGTRPFLYFAAALGGFSRELEAKLAPILKGDMALRPTYDCPPLIDLIFGLDDPALVEHYIRTLDIPLRFSYQGRAWLAHTETRALDWLERSLLDWLECSIRSRSKPFPNPFFEVLALVEDEVTVPIMLNLQRQRTLAEAAIQWLDEHRELAVHYAAAAFSQKPTGDVRRLLRAIKNRHGLDALAGIHFTDPQVQATYQTEILDFEDDSLPRFTDVDTPDWLKQGLEDVTTPKHWRFPIWLTRDDLSPLTYQGHRLNNQQIEAVIVALKISTFAAPHPLIALLKTHLDPVVLDRFVWELFETWLERSAPAKDRWPILSLGLWGNDSSAIKLTPFILKWSHEAQYAQAVMGLKCLGQLGTDTALMQVKMIDQNASVPAIEKAVQAALEAVTKDRGLTRD